MQISLPTLMTTQHLISHHLHSTSNLSQAVQADFEERNDFESGDEVSDDEIFESCPGHKSNVSEIGL